MADDTLQLNSILSAVAAARARGDKVAEARALEDGLRAFPDNLRLLNARGMRAMADGDPHRAIRHFEHAVELEKGELVLWMNLAGAYRAIGDDELEKQSLEQALTIERGNAAAQLRLAQLEQRRGNNAAALQHWVAVLQLTSAMTDIPEPMEAAIEAGRAFVVAHNDRLAAEIEAELGAEVAADPVAARRFNACVDHALGRRRIYHNECAGILFPFLPADEYFDRHHFPWLSELEARTDVIRKEAIALLASDHEAIRPYVQQESGLPENKWSKLDQSKDWSACFLWHFGKKIEAICDLCPETAKAIEAVPRSNIPGKAPTAFFSILKPRTRIPPHTGVTNTRAIVHLPLVVPRDCYFRVGGETRPWEEGKAFVFDDSIDHEAINDSDEVRIILILDVWNPHMTEQERAWLTKFYAISNRDAA